MRHNLMVLKKKKRRQTDVMVVKMITLRIVKAKQKQSFHARQICISTKSIPSATHSKLYNCLTQLKSRIHTNIPKLNCKKRIDQKSLTKSTQNFTLSIDCLLPTLICNPAFCGIAFSFEQISQLDQAMFFCLENTAHPSTDQSVNT